MQNPIRSGMLLLVFVVAAAAQPPSQSWDSVKALPGKSVRVTANSRSVSGPLQIAADDSLTVITGNGPQIFKRQEVTRVSVKKESHRGRNALIGLGAGAAAGATTGAISHGPDTSGGFNFGGRGAFAGIGAAIFGVIGAVVGAVIPAGWHDVYSQ